MTHLTKFIPLANLTLNIENPRFEMVGSQREAILTMLDNQGDKLVRLAEDIIENQLNPTDIISVSPHEKLEKQYNVLEGNRRITALKLLNNPELIPEKNKSLLNKFRKLNEEYLKAPIEEVNCVVFENEEEARKWIKLKHTGENDGIGTVTWDAQQKARFEERNEGKSSYALQLIDFMSQQESVAQDLKDRLKDIPSSSLKRLIGDPDFRKMVGIEIQNGIVFTKYNPIEIIKPLTKVMTDLLRDDFTVKEIYYKDDRANYLETFKPSDLPNKSNELDSMWQLNSNIPPIVTSKHTIPKKSKPLSTDRNVIIPKSLIIRISNPRINKLYRELKDLDLREFENAAAITFRVFIELSLDEFIEQIEDITTVDKNSELSKKCTAVAEYMKNKGYLDKYKLKGINTAATNPNSIMSINTFNAYIHNKDFSPEPKSLKVTWDNIEPFILKIWELI